MENKMTKWQQEARIRCIRLSRRHGGIQGWIYQRSILGGWFEELTAIFMDDCAVRLYANGADGTGQEEYDPDPEHVLHGWTYSGGWGTWLPDAARV